jgi:hypothetical protein
VEVDGDELRVEHAVDVRAEVEKIDARTKRRNADGGGPAVPTVGGGDDG